MRRWDILEVLRFFAAITAFSTGILIILSLEDNEPECKEFRRKILFPKLINGRVEDYFLDSHTKLFTVEFENGGRLENRCGMNVLFKEIRVGDSLFKCEDSYIVEVIKADTILIIDVTDTLDYESLPRIPTGEWKPD